MNYQKPKTKFRKGAASFYIVAFSTLILVVIAMSFAAVIISEVTRTSNDDLAQSAYDSALAGIEDAKLAYYNYQSCIETKATYDDQLTASDDVSCQDIVYWMNHPDCDMVGHILGRIPKNGPGGEVLIQETKDGDNNMQQAYTCVKLDLNTSDYRTTLTSDNSTRVIQVELEDKQAQEITFARISWYSNTDGSDYQFTNVNGNNVIFPTLATKAATPPTISVGLVQTATNFALSEFDDASYGAKAATNRGTVYLVPTKDENVAGKDELPDNHIGAYGRGNHSGINFITASDMVKSNDRTVKNLPYTVYCDQNGEFACSATIELPNVIQHGADSARNNDTFMFVVNVPYGQPSTDISLELCTSAEANDCVKTTSSGEDGGSTEESSSTTNIATLHNVQVKIDSTGRANDLYRRIEARLDTFDTYFPYPLYALELLGNNGNDPNLVKDMTVTCEYQRWGSFAPTCP